MEPLYYSFRHDILGQYLKAIGLLCVLARCVAPERRGKCLRPDPQAASSAKQSGANLAALRRGEHRRASCTAR
jgi:hypothetical protein